MIGSARHAACRAALRQRSRQEISMGHSRLLGTEPKALPEDDPADDGHPGEDCPDDDDKPKTAT
jgi:hypothetical protein